MALPNRNLTLDAISEPGPDLDDEDLENLESEVMQLAQKISEYRKTLPAQLRSTLDSVLSSQRPILPSIESPSDPGPAFPTISESEDPIVPAIGTEEEQSAEKIIQLKERISRNIAMIPTVVERMRECIDRIDKLNSAKETIHPAFRRRGTT